MRTFALSGGAAPDECASPREGTARTIEFSKIAELKSYLSSVVVRYMSALSALSAVMTRSFASTMMQGNYGYCE